MPLFQSKPQEGHGLHMEFAFFSFHEQTILKQSLKDQPNTSHMICLIFGENENVIHIDKHKVVNEISQYIVHHCLKNSGSIGESKRHYKILKVTQVSVECRFPIISLTDGNQVVRLVEIQF